MEDNNKEIKADSFLEAALCGGGDMVLPPDDPCVDCDGLGCPACPFDNRNDLDSKQKELDVTQTEIDQMQVKIDKARKLNQYYAGNQKKGS